MEFLVCWVMGMRVHGGELGCHKYTYLHVGRRRWELPSISLSRVLLGKRVMHAREALKALAYALLIVRE